MKRFRAGVLMTLALAVGAFVLAGPAASAPEATITFTPDVHACTLTITSSKDISNFTVNGVKTEGIPSGTTTIVLQLQGGETITVKSGTTTQTFVMPACHAPDDHDGDGDHDGDDHLPHDHDGDGVADPDHHH